MDFNLPNRFDITYVDSDQQKKRPIMIHRAVLGSLERFFGVLIEHYAGDFPLWLSPIQTRVLPVTDAQVHVQLVVFLLQYLHLHSLVNRNRIKTINRHNEPFQILANTAET